jgi:hypothetical protein
MVSPYGSHGISQYTMEFLKQQTEEYIKSYIILQLNYYCNRKKNMFHQHCEYGHTTTITRIFCSAKCGTCIQEGRKEGRKEGRGQDVNKKLRNQY